MTFFNTLTFKVVVYRFLKKRECQFKIPARERIFCLVHRLIEWTTNFKFDETSQVRIKVVYELVINKLFHTILLPKNI